MDYRKVYAGRDAAFEQRRLQRIAIHAAALRIDQHGVEVARMTIGAADGRRPIDWQVAQAVVVALLLAFVPYLILRGIVVRLWRVLTWARPAP